MKDKNQLKSIVRDKYGEIARNSSPGCGCGSDSCCSSDTEVDYTAMSEKYSGLDGYVAGADLGLGCGLPTEYAGIRNGDTVVDLGSGAGNDAFVARSIVGEEGQVIGVDMTTDMIDLAITNNRKLGYENVSFILGEIEKLPLEEESADVVVSNCVLNLVPDKEKAFGEIHRVLKAGGQFCISDIVLNGELPEALRKSAELYAGCVAGAIQENEYLDIIRRAGFSMVSVRKKKLIDLPDDLLQGFLTDDELSIYKASDTGIASITVTAFK